jgi:dTDP-4-amino-4,6-dideoxygalactose transaminase
MVPAELAPDGADHLMVVLLPAGSDRDAVRASLTAAGIATSVHFRPLHRFAWFAEHAVVGAGGLSVAESLADRALSLPLYPGLRGDDVDRVVAALAAALRSP